MVGDAWASSDAGATYDIKDHRQGSKYDNENRLPWGQITSLMAHVLWAPSQQEERDRLGFPLSGWGAGICMKCAILLQEPGKLPRYRGISSRSREERLESAGVHRPTS